ncbi:MAG TPA: hypothetical protein VI172_08425 [Candidatus Dormibacteraeota bacterium]|jgi:hypothetical protein
MTAHITPQPDGSAVLELDGVPARFVNFPAALEQARKSGRQVITDRFPMTRADAASGATSRL